MVRATQLFEGHVHALGIAMGSLGGGVALYNPGKGMRKRTTAQQDNWAIPTVSDKSSDSFDRRQNGSGTQFADARAI